MQNDVKISVIIPAYNSAAYLPRCLDSVLQNTHSDLEVICINDGSTDDTGDILRSYAARDARIVAIQKANGGVSAARNDGLEAATGDWVCFIDSDDWVHPCFFALMLDHAVRSGADMVVTDLFRTAEVVPFSPLPAQDLDSSVLHTFDALQNYTVKSHVIGRMYRTALVKPIRFERRLSFGEDLLFNIRVFCQSADISVCLVQDTIHLYDYFDRPDSLVYTADNREQLLQSRIFFSCAQQETSPVFRRIYLTEAMKKAFSARYGALYDPVQKDLRIDCRKLLSEESRCLRTLPGISVGEKVKYLLFSRCPSAYRLWRVRSDPTLLQWEKEQRKKAKKHSEIA